MTSIQKGSTFPDFSLPDADGTLVSSADLAGRPFVVFFYPKDDTSGCTSEAKDFSAAEADFADLSCAVFGVSPDPVPSHAKFRKKHDLAVRLLSDEQRSLIENAGVWVEKSMYGRRYWGVERTTVLVDAEGTVARVWPKVSVAGHAAEVLEAARTSSGQATSKGSTHS